MDNIESLLLLNMVRGVGPVRIRALISHFANYADIFKADLEELIRLEGIDQALARRIKSAIKDIDLKKELSQIKKNDVNILTILDSAYPKNLREIYDAPVVLYVRGNIIESDNFSISIVGTRRPSKYGLVQSRMFSYELALSGITVVSGMARGIDTAAHKGALEVSRGRTIAVLGSGFNCIYPPENKALFNRIGNSGAVISEFSMDTPPNKENFPRRNRIISGFSFGTLVVEAAKNSGSLITARFALEQNRDVFALPGNISSGGSYGTNKLIKEGAKLVENTKDIIEELRPLVTSMC